MAFSRVHFESTTAKGLTCPDCGKELTFDRTCLKAMLTCRACGREFDPARFVAELEDDFEEAYANITIDRM